MSLFIKCHISKFQNKIFKMHGILWKWLFSLGVLLWGSLCGVDYYRKHIIKHPEFWVGEIKIEENIFTSQKKIPPALTFWKTLSMVLSVSALIYIKRSSLKKCSKTSILVSYSPYNELDKSTMFPGTVNYYKDVKSNEILPDLYSNESRPKLSPIKKKPYYSSVIGVQLVQKKLENLEKNLASLKQRHQESSATLTASSGIVSGSPEFRRFLNSCTQLKPSSESLDISINSSQLSATSKVPGSDLISTISSSDRLGNMSGPQAINSSSSSTASIQEVKKEPSSTIVVPLTVVDTPDIISNNFTAKNEDSWSTISDDESIASNKTNRQVLSTVSGQITEILRVKHTFSKCSKLSEEFKINNRDSNVSIASHLTDCDGSLLVEYDDDLEVPGSNLVSTSGTSSGCTSTTLMSEATVPLFMGDTADFFDDEDILNTLD